MKEQIRSNLGMAHQPHCHQGGPLSLISCVSGRESSPLNENDSHETVEMKTETKKKRFHPLRNLRRMFRRKSRQSNVSNESYKLEAPVPNPATANATTTTSSAVATLEQRSCSTSRLLEDELSQNRMSKNGLAPGLSLSHDSVFTPGRADSGHSSSDLENSSLSIPILIPANRFQAELANAVRRRNRGESEDEEDEDLGLPRSPCSSLTTADVFREKTQEAAIKSQSSCSEASLLSMASSDVEIDAPNSRSDLDLSVTSQKLSHSAAKHKMAVRPKRNHGAPHNKRRMTKSGSALPVTPEVNEETGIPRSASPEATQPAAVATSATSPETRTSESFSSATSPSLSHLDEDKPVLNDLQVKSASLPHGAALSTSPKVVRSRSNVAGFKKSEKATTVLQFYKRSLSNEDEIADKSKDDQKLYKEDENDGKKEESFFGRLLPRKSAKKKKSDPELKPETETVEITEEEKSSSTHYTKKLPCTKSHHNSKTNSAAAAVANRTADRRQRVEPIDIPSSPSIKKKEEFTSLSRNVREASNRMKISYSMSPPKAQWPSQLLSRSISPPKAVWPENYSQFSKQDTRQKSYQNNWDESFKQMNRDVPDGHFIKNETPSSKFLKRDKSPTKIRRESSPSKFECDNSIETKAKVTISTYDKFPIQKSQSFRKEINIPVNVYANLNSKKDETENKVNITTNVNVRLSQDEDANKRLYTKNSNLTRSKVLKKDDLPKKSASLECIGTVDVDVNDGGVSVKSASSESFRSSFPGADVIVTHEEPRYANLKNLLPNLRNYEKVHHGYENIQIIELVKKEAAESKTSQTRNFFEDLSNKSKVKMPEPEPEKKPPKPPILEKPKELKKEVPEFMRVHLNKVERTPDEKATLVERRKSELSSTNETDEVKPKVKTLKKQTSFTETGSPKKINLEDVKKRTSLNEDKVKSVLNQKPEDNVVIVEKTEITEECEVVLRKKSIANETEEPELMKVFARRSLKLKEDEIVEDVQRSRDSDKENENVESPKEERKKIVKSEPEPEEETKTNATPLKPAVITRNSVFHKYGRSLSENGVKKNSEEVKVKSEILVKVESRSEKENSVTEANNKINKTRSLSEEQMSGSKGWSGVATDKVLDVTNVEKEGEESEDTGFKRIQQRKAEWERRVQQAAKQ